MPPTPPGSHLAGRPRAHWTVEAVAGCPYGVLVCAVTPEPIPPTILDALHATERRYAASLYPHRRREWIAGRYCLAEALKRIAAPRTPLLTTRSGAPDVPAGFAGSISHKGPFTVAIATDRHRFIGLDVEHAEPHDTGLISKVLNTAERSVVNDQSCPDSPARFVAFHFAVKEAVYKASEPREQREMEFGDIELEQGCSARFLLEATWIMQRVRVRNTSWESPAAVLTEGDWVLAIAARL